MSTSDKSKNTSKNTPKTGKTKSGNRFAKRDSKPAAEVKPEVETKPVAVERKDTKGPHKAAAIAKARAAFKALGLTAPAAFDAIESGTAKEADYVALKEQTDALKVAVNALGCHFQTAKAAAGAKA